MYCRLEHVFCAGCTPLVFISDGVAEHETVAPVPAENFMPTQPSTHCNAHKSPHWYCAPEQDSSPEHVSEFSPPHR
jgi:hypothetical protein